MGTRGTRGTRGTMGVLGVRAVLGVLGAPGPPFGALPAGEDMTSRELAKPPGNDDQTP